MSADGISCSKRVSGFDMAPPGPAMLANAAVTAAAATGTCHIMYCCSLLSDNCFFPLLMI